MYLWQAQALFEKACAERDAAVGQLSAAEAAGLEMIEVKANSEARTAECVQLKADAKKAALTIAELQGEVAAQKEMHAQQVVETAIDACLRLYTHGHTHTLTHAHAHAHAHTHTHTHIHTQVAELQNLASDARTAREEREAKQDALDKLAAARSKVTALEEQLEQLHVLRGSDEANAKEAAVQQVHDKLAERDAEIQRLLQQLDVLRGDLEASRDERGQLVARQTQSLQDELLRVNTLLQAGTAHNTELKEQVATLQESAASFDPVIQEYKRSLDLKESEIETLRRARDTEFQQLREQKAHVEKLNAEQNAELVLAREEISNLQRAKSSLGKAAAGSDAGRDALTAELAAAQADLASAQAEVERLRDAEAQAAEVNVMRERVRAAESEAELANVRLEKLDEMERLVERKERDLQEERERNQRLRSEMNETRGGAIGAQGEWAGKQATLERRLEEAEDLRHKAEFALSLLEKEKASLDSKVSELAEELAEARVKIGALESQLKLAKEGSGAELKAQMDQDLKREMTAKAERAAAREAEAKEEAERLQRRVAELEDALNTSVDPSGGESREAVRRAQDAAARERDARKAVEAQLDELNDEFQRLKDRGGGLRAEEAGGDSDHLQMRVASVTNARGALYSDLCWTCPESFTYMRHVCIRCGRCCERTLSATRRSDCWALRSLGSLRRSRS